VAKGLMCHAKRPSPLVTNVHMDIEANKVHVFMRG
jgi:hypothetical protein